MQGKQIAIQLEADSMIEPNRGMYFIKKITSLASLNVASNTTSAQTSSDKIAVLHFCKPTQPLAFPNNSAAPAKNILQIAANHGTNWTDIFKKLNHFFSAGHRHVVLDFRRYQSTLAHDIDNLHALLHSLVQHSVELITLTDSESSLPLMIYGAALTLEQEYTNFNHRMIIAKTPLNINLREVFKLAFANTSRWLAIDNHTLYRLDWHAVALLNQSTVPQTGNMVVIGGAGAVGSKLVKHLATFHQSRVFILGRRDIDSRMQQQFKKDGVKSYFKVDIEDVNQLTNTLTHIKQKYGDINTIYHLAGVIKDKLFQNKSKDDFTSVIKVKVLGLESLSKVSPIIRPQSVVCFSSLTGVIGNVGQADYAAANAALNRVTQLNQQQPYTSWKVVHWGLWDTKDGMTMQPNASIQPLNTRNALQMLDDFLQNQPGDTAAIYQGDPELLSAPSVTQSQSEHTTLLQTSSQQRADWKQQLASDVMNIVLKKTKFRHLGHDHSLLSLGIDSIIATHIATHLQQYLKQYDNNVKIPKTLLFQHDTVDSIVDYITMNYAEKITASLQKLSESPPKSTSKTLHRKSSQESQCNHLAIVGMAGEFPAADDLISLWDMLKNGRSGITSVPQSRWDWTNDFTPNKNQLDASYCRHGGFLNHADQFDCNFFNITPRDAIKLDPQVRRLLHQSYSALAQCDFLEQSQGNVGVFTSAMYSHYQALSAKDPIDSSFSAIANHLSFYYNYHGPSLCVDSMCSGGLTALHLARNSLLLNECDAAIVAAVNIMPHPGKYRFLSQQQFLSQQGNCSSFGIAADGYVPGEGVIALVVKPLAKAKKDNNRIHGIIRGSAINTTAKRSRFTVPDAQSQAHVIQQALNASQLTCDQITHIEAHGTGTSLGDPIEIEGLNQIFEHTSQTVSVSSIKSNIGHLESAAGLAGIVKTLLQMHFELKVASINCNIINPSISLDHSALEIIQSNVEWKNRQQAVFSGVSAFGAGGSNAHVILESPPADYRFNALPQPFQQFKSQPFWANLSSPQPPRSVDTPHSTNRDESYDTSQIGSVSYSVLKNRPISSPLKRDTLSQNVIILVTKNQYDKLETSSDYSSRIVVCSFDNSSLMETLEKSTKQSVHLINACSLDNETHPARQLKIQFKLAKMLTRVTQPIDHLFIEPSSLHDVEPIFKQSSHHIFRTLALEHRNIRAHNLQVDRNLIEIIELFSTHLIDPSDTYKRYTLRQDQWFVEELSDLKHHSQKSTSLIKQQGIYLVTGGFGEIARLLCASLLRDFNARIICIGRSPLNQTKQQVLEQLSQIHPTIEYHQGDITQRKAMKQLIDYVEQRYSTIHGVIHSACVLHDGLFREKSWNDFIEVIKCKVLGATILDQLTQSIPLDFFVSFSSISSIFGNVGQADYTVANGFLDQFSAHRNKLVKQGHRYGQSLTINWPLWSVETKDLSSASIEFIGESLGIDPLTHQDGVGSFYDLLTQHTHYQVIPVKKKLIESIKPVATELTKTRGKTNQSVLQQVINIIADVTQIDIVDLDTKTSINDIGMTSVALAELASKIETACSISLAPSVFFSHDSIQAIVAYIQKKQQVSIVDSSQSTIVEPTTEKQTNDDDGRFAIIGMDCLLPGGPDPEAFWNFLCNNQSAVKKLSRWSDYDYSGAILDDIAQFDPQFFKLSHREAVLMDPQHRLFLQVAYNALLNACYTPHQLSRVGVFVGVQFNDYQHLTQAHAQTSHPYAATGNSHAMLANRVSYLFDFTGPSETVDTACSSTLVAINRGLLALKQKECDMVLTGATSLLIDPNTTKAAQSMGILSPSFRSATFDRDADGYVRGEGVGAFVIKRLQDAIADRDPIHAVIESIAENHGGRANSLTSPNPKAQKALLKKAYSAPLANQVGFIETHGTGTKLGDPIEIDALKQAFADLSPSRENQSILLGAVKTNVGHLEPAAGIPSIIKSIFILKTGLIPANLHFNSQNPYIELDNSPFKLATQNTMWQNETNRVVGVSCFGFGGSNTHMVLSKPLSTSHQKDQLNHQYPVVLSAQHKDSLASMKRNLMDFLEKHPETPLSSLSFTLCTAREHFKEKFACIAASIDELIVHLSHESDVTHVPYLKDFLDDKSVDWTKHYPHEINKVHLPGYVFHTQAFWVDPNATFVETTHEV